MEDTDLCPPDHSMHSALVRNAEQKQARARDREMQRAAELCARLLCPCQLEVTHVHVAASFGPVLPAQQSPAPSLQC